MGKSYVPKKSNDYLSAIESTVRPAFNMLWANPLMINRNMTDAMPFVDAVMHSYLTAFRAGDMDNRQYAKDQLTKQFLIAHEKMSVEEKERELRAMLSGRQKNHQTGMFHQNDNNLITRKLRDLNTSQNHVKEFMHEVPPFSPLKFLNIFKLICFVSRVIQLGVAMFFNKIESMAMNGYRNYKESLSISAGKSLFVRALGFGVRLFAGLVRVVKVALSLPFALTAMVTAPLAEIEMLKPKPFVADDSGEVKNDYQIQHHQLVKVETPNVLRSISNWFMKAPIVEKTLAELRRVSGRAESVMTQSKETKGKHAMATLDAVRQLREASQKARRVSQFNPSRALRVEAEVAAVQADKMMQSLMETGIVTKAGASKLGVFNEKRLIRAVPVKSTNKPGGAAPAA